MELEGRSSKIGQLIRLSQIEYDVEQGQPDLIGWPVADADGEVIGRLDDMLVDIETGDIPFGSVSFDDRRTAVPLELMFMDEANQRLVLPVTRAELANAPEFSDETEDMQLHMVFWNQMVAGWQQEMLSGAGKEAEVSPDER